MPQHSDVTSNANHCSQCGAPYSLAAVESPFCEFCGFAIPLPVAQGDERLKAHQMLCDYVAHRNWTRAAETIRALLSYSRNARERALYLHTLARVTAELGDIDPALSYWRQSLTTDPTLLRAFEGMATTLVEAKQWTVLESEYKQMLGRTKDRQVLRVLWSGLGSLYTDHLHNAQAAQFCRERAAHLAD